MEEFGSGLNAWLSGENSVGRVPRRMLEQFLVVTDKVLPKLFRWNWRLRWRMWATSNRSRSNAMAFIVLQRLSTWPSTGVRFQWCPHEPIVTSMTCRHFQLSPSLPFQIPHSSTFSSQSQLNFLNFLPILLVQPWQFGQLFFKWRDAKSAQSCFT